MSLQDKKPLVLSLAIESEAKLKETRPWIDLTNPIQCLGSLLLAILLPPLSNTIHINSVLQHHCRHAVLVLPCPFLWLDRTSFRLGTPLRHWNLGREMSIHWIECRGSHDQDGHLQGGNEKNLL